MVLRVRRPRMLACAQLIRKIDVLQPDRHGVLSGRTFCGPEPVESTVLIAPDALTG